MPILPFTGSDFFFESVTQLSMATIRLKYSQDPLAIDPDGPHDALNVSLYSIGGPIVNAVTFASAVPDDPQSIDLTLAAPLILGTWVLQGSTSLWMATTRPLQPPTAIVFEAIEFANSEPLVAGPVNDGPEDVIRKHTNPVLQGRVWNALISALGVGSKVVWDNARLAFDQLYLSTARGLYLNRKGADVGVPRPLDTGMSDDLYRRYAIATTAHKLTQESLLEILEVFYGTDAVKAYVDTDALEPFVLQDGMYLDFLLDGETSIRIVFSSSDFAQITQARAIEVAAAITRGFRNRKLHAQAIAIKDPTTGSGRVRVYSASRGLSSSIAVTGGTAQPVLLFPDSIDTVLSPITGADLYTWSVDNPTPFTTRFSLSIDTSIPPAPKLDLSGVRAGDYVAVSAVQAQVPGGVYNIVDVSVTHAVVLGLPTSTLIQSFTIDRDIGFTGPALQLSDTAYHFFRSTRHTTQRGDNRTVVVSENGLTELDVLIPATTQVVSRTLLNAAYGQQQGSLAITDFNRDGNGLVTVTVPGHGMAAGDNFIVEGLGSSLSVPTRVDEMLTDPQHGDLAVSPLSIWSEIGEGVNRATEYHTLTQISMDRIIKTGGAWGDVGGPFTVVSNCEDISFSFSGGVWHWVRGPVVPFALALPRAQHTATIVLNGLRIFFAGGEIDSVDGNATATTELLDFSVPALPVTVPGSPTMSIPKTNHTATLMDDGTVLIVGGDSLPLPATHQALDLVDSYDPASNSITAKATLNGSRYSHQALKLQDGRVLVVGGRFDDTTITSSCEIYDPGSNTWSVTGYMAWTRYGHRLVLLKNGFVIAVGGRGHNVSQGGADTGVAAVEMFDPGTGRWQNVCRLPIGRQDPVVAYYPDRDRVIVSFGTAETLAHGGTGTTAVIDTKNMLVIPGPGYSQTGPYAYPILINGPQSVQTDSGLVYADGANTTSNTPGSGAAYVPGSDVVTAGGLDGEFEVVQVLGPDSFTYQSQVRAYTVNPAPVGAFVIPFAAQDSAIPGPFIFDPSGSPAVTAVDTVTTQELVQGQQYRTLAVADATQFPDTPGWLVLAFGTGESVFPVQYLGRFSDLGLLLDYNFKFPKTLPTGTDVTLLQGKGLYEPGNATELGAFYLTASSSGRVAAVQALNNSLAAGGHANITVVYPGDIGLGNAGTGITGHKISDIVEVFAGNDVDAEVSTARGT